jgi:ribosomal protein S4E
LQVQCSVNPKEANPGDEISWSSQASGGTGNYSYIWTKDVTGNTANEKETYSATGTKHGKVIVTSGNQQRSAQCDMEIKEPTQPLSASCDTIPAQASTSEQVDWFVDSVSGGDGGYTYSWSGDATGTSDTVTETYSATGTKQATVEVTDTSGNQVSPACSMDVVSSESEELHVDCQVSPSTASTSDPVEWSAHNIIGGSGNYSYSWTGDANGSTESVTETYTATGTKQATLTVTDENKNIQNTDQCQMTVSDDGGSGDFNLSLGDPFSWLVSNSGLRSTKTEINLSKMNGFSKPVTLTAASASIIDNNATKFVLKNGPPQETITVTPDQFSDSLTVHVRDSIDAASYPLTVSAQTPAGPTKTAPMTLYVRSFMEF